VRVNGVLTDESRLHSGDEIAIGPLLFRFEDEVPPPPKSDPKVKAEGNPKPSRPSTLPDMPIDPDADLVPLSGLFPHL
jgi:hypothetical protein